MVNVFNTPVTYKRLVRQVWYGVALGAFICLCIGAGFIGAFYGAGKDHWSGTELIWEGTFALVASIIITIIGAGLLRVSKLKAKWQVKLAKAIEPKYANDEKTAGSRFKSWCVKYAMFNLTFITVLREGIEAVVFIAGIGSYDIRQSVWHVNCCSPNLNGGGGWGIFNALLGWQNSATYGSVISYNLYWLIVIIAFTLMRYNEKNGHWPYMKKQTVKAERESSVGSNGDEAGIVYTEKTADTGAVLTVVKNSEV
ncbi:MAG: hypothetical protein Q9163_000188 [Psora crenata]